MTIKVGINGFGRIGRMVFRAIQKDFPELEVVGINDLLDNDYLSYMLRYDSAHGRFDGDVTVDGDNFVINGKKIRLSAERNPADLKWGDIDVDVAIDCTGFFLTEESCQAHIDAGAKKVVQSAPSKDGTPMFVYGVNHDTYDGQKIISAASCTTNCLAPLVKCLNESMQISSGIINTIHAATNDQNVLDNYHSDPYRARSSFESLIPTKTGAASAIGKIIPELNGKLTGLATRVPVTNVSMLDFTFTAKNILTIDELKELLLNASNTSLKNILSINDDPLVSSDFNGKKASCIVDFNFIEKVENQYKLIAWYDNESGFSNRMIDLAKFWLDLEYGDNVIKKVI